MKEKENLALVAQLVFELVCKHGHDMTEGASKAVALFNGAGTQEDLGEERAKEAEAHLQSAIESSRNAGRAAAALLEVAAKGKKAESACGGVESFAEKTGLILESCGFKRGEEKGFDWTEKASPSFEGEKVKALFWSAGPSGHARHYMSISRVKDGADINTVALPESCIDDIDFCEFVAEMLMSMEEL